MRVCKSNNTMELLPNEIQYHILEYTVESAYICMRVCSTWHSLTQRSVLTYLRLPKCFPSYVKSVISVVHPGSLRSVVAWIVQNNICEFVTHKAVRIALEYRFSVGVVRRMLKMESPGRYGLLKPLDPKILSTCTPSLIKVLLSENRVDHYQAVAASIQHDNLALFAYLWSSDPDITYSGDSCTLAAVKMHAWKILSWLLRRGHSRSLRKMLGSVYIRHITELINVLQKYYPEHVIDTTMESLMADEEFSNRLIQHYKASNVIATSAIAMPFQGASIIIPRNGFDSRMMLEQTSRRH